MSFPVSDWQFWVASVVVLVIVLTVLRRVARIARGDRSRQRVELTIDRKAHER